MSRAGFKKRIGKCKYKTSKGNVYENYTIAKIQAVQLGNKVHIFLEPYYCDVCNKFHIGKGIKIYSFPRYQNYGIIQFLFGKVDIR